MAAIIAHAIGSGHLRQRHQRLDGACRGIAGIRADIRQHVRGQSEQLAVCVEGSFQRHILIATVETRDQILAPVFRPCHRRPQLARQEHQGEVFRGQRHFLSESAADIGRDHPQIVLRHVEQFGDRRAHDMRILGSSMSG